MQSMQVMLGFTTIVIYSKTILNEILEQVYRIAGLSERDTGAPAHEV